MKPRKQIYLLIFLIALLLAALSCSLTQPDEPDPGPELPETATPLPTNQVELIDAGAPLAPRILATSPDGGQELAAEGSIEVIFDQAMDVDLTAQAWQLLAPDGSPVSGQIDWPDSHTLVYRPGTALERGQVYRVELSNQASSQEGVAFADPVTFEVMVAGDLQVSQVFPADQTLAVEANAVITVIFNRPVVPLTMSTAQADLPQPLTFEPGIAGQGEWLSTSVYVFQPAETLNSQTTYTARVGAGLTDTLGSTLPQDYVWQFTTAAPSIDAFGLYQPNLIYYPENNYTGVYLESSFMIDFRQPMEVESTEAAFSLDSQAGETVPVDFTWVTDVQLLITPTRQLALGTHYTLLLAETAQAATGGTLAEGLRWNFQTLLPPAILDTTPSDQSQQSYYSNWFSVRFASPMRLETIKERVVIDPPPAGEINWYYDSWGWQAEFYGLQAATDYTIEFLPGMEDLYGNSITTGTTVSFRTGSYEASARLDLPYGPSLYRLNGPQKFFASYVNVDDLEFQIYRLSAGDFAGFTSGIYSTWDYNPPASNLVRSWQVQAEDVADQRIRRELSLKAPDGTPLTPGFYLLTVDSAQVQHDNPFLDTRLLIVASANLTYKSTQSEALLWLTDLESGAPLPNVPLAIYDGYDLVAQGTTNQSGILKLDVPPNTYDRGARYAVTVTGGPLLYPADQPLGLALDSWGSGVSPYDFGIWSDFYSEPNLPAVYVYTDRPLYRPGQTVSFKGLLRLNDDLRYSLPALEQVVVVISDYNQTIYRQTLSISEFGSFDAQLVLDENAALGYYWIEVQEFGADDAIGGVGFSVAEYRKPEFQVLVTPDQAQLLGGETFNIEILAEYYSGGYVSQADVTWAVRAEDYFFQPEGELSTYSFSDFDWDLYYYETGFGPQAEIIAQGNGLTDAEGRLVISLPADLSDAQASRSFTFEATVNDFAGTAVSGRAELIGHRAAYYPGIKPQTYLGQQGQAQTFELVVVDWAAQPVADQAVTVQIVERRWSSIQEQDAQGYVHWTSSVEELAVEQFEDVLTDARGRAQVTFTPPTGGVYKAYITVRDADGNQARSGAYMWVSSDDYIPWRVDDDRRIDLVSDQDSYAVGDAAEILIASPFSGENFALVTVERGHIRQQDVVRLTSNSAVYRLPITADMAPNVYVSVLVIKGAARDGVPDFRMGIINLPVAVEQQAITVEITPDREQAGPGEQVTYQIRTTNYLGQPVQAEVSISLADLATLSLSGPNSQPILDFFYGERSLSVRTAVPIVLSVEHYLQALQDQLSDGLAAGSGGGKGADEFGVFDVRQDFPDTAFWQAQVRTDVNGEAEITVTLPDNLTIWRLDARAITLDTLVGDTLHDLRSTLPLLIRPQTPRFFVVGDRVTLGAAVHNNSGAPLSVAVELKTSGVTLETAATQQVDVAAGGRVYVTWEAVVLPDVDRVDLIFSASGGGYSDATRPTLGTLDNQGIPVYRYEAPETVGTAGMLAVPGSLTEGISLPPNLTVEAGSLTVKISPSLAAGITEGLEYLEHYPYECLEQTVSRFLPNIMTTLALQAAGQADAEMLEQLNAQVAIALQRIYNWQRPDGGWGWWPSSQHSDPLTSAYVVMGLVEAERAGYAVSASALDRGLNYLTGSLQSLSALDAQTSLNRQAFTLYVLARAGKPQVSQTVQFFEIRQSLSLYARAYLAEALFWIDAEDPRLDTLLSDFANAAIRSATGTHWEEDWDDYWNWNTDTRTTAIVLAALIQIRPEDALNPNAVRWLMSNRTQGHWATTQETAWSLMALTGWMVASGELQADYDWAVGLNGERLGDGSANAQNLRTTQELTADIQLLLTDTVNRLTIARDEGTGNLYYTAFLQVNLPVDQIQPLDRGMLVTRQYYDPQDRQSPIRTAQQGDLLLARLTLVVPHALHYVVVNDPLPAGLEAVDTSLLTNPDVTAPQAYDFETQWRQGWGWWYFDHVQFRDEAVLLSAEYLPAGTYVYTYLVRAATPGEFHVIPPTAQEFYFPEVYGRGAGSLFVVAP